MGVKSVSFKADPYFILQTTIQLHVEKEYDREEKYENSLVCALYEFLNTVSEQELDELWTAYTKKECIEDPYTITGFKKETEALTKEILQTERFKTLKLRYQIDAYDGSGVVDKINQIFYPCDYGGHWPMIVKITNEHHGGYFSKNDNFFLKNFLLVGATKKIEWHLNSMI